MKHFPLFPEYSRVWEIFQTFNKKCMFHPPKSLMTYFSHWLYFEFVISSYFSQRGHISPISENVLFPPDFDKFSSAFVKYTCFLRTLRVFRFSHTLTMMHLCINNARTGRLCARERRLYLADLTFGRRLLRTWPGLVMVDRIRLFYAFVIISANEGASPGRYPHLLTTLSGFCAHLWTFYRRRNQIAFV